MSKKIICTKQQYNYIKNLLNKYCLANVYKKTYEYIFKEELIYYNDEKYHAILDLVNAVRNNYKYLIVKEV